MPSWKSLRPFMIAALAIVPAGAGAALLFVESGLYDVGAASPHNLFSEWLTHETMIHSVRRHSRGIAVSAGFDAAQVLSGFCAYQVHCSACHGAPAVARQLWATGMEPSPPYLIDVSRRFRPEELFWMVKNGIKMTGMPSWNNEMSDAQIWSVVAWLEVGPKLAPQTYVRWRAADKCRGAIGLPSLDPERPSTHRP
jgi:mono/diheme cytochrome c family protein